jgi:hypothetical protein
VVAPLSGRACPEPYGPAARGHVATGDAQRESIANPAHIPLTRGADTWRGERKARGAWSRWRRGTWRCKTR